MHDTDWPEPETYPGVVNCRGGWFAVEGPRELGSGPWKNEEAARAVLDGDYRRAHELNGTSK